MSFACNLVLYELHPQSAAFIVAGAIGSSFIKIRDLYKDPSGSPGRRAGVVIFIKIELYYVIFIKISLIFIKFKALRPSRRGVVIFIKFKIAILDLYKDH